MCIYDLLSIFYLHFERTDMNFRKCILKFSTQALHPFIRPVSVITLKTNSKLGPGGSLNLQILYLVVTVSWASQSIVEVVSIYLYKQVHWTTDGHHH